jgi:hypothetical protein
MDMYEATQTKIKDTWNRVSEMGYVDNAASIILGVPAGTLSKEAREAEQKRLQDIQDTQTAMENEKELKDYDYELQLKIDKSRETTTSDYDTAMEMWKTAGVASAEVAKVLGIPVGAKTADYDLQSRQESRLATSGSSGTSSQSGITFNDAQTAITNASKNLLTPDPETEESISKTGIPYVYAIATEIEKYRGILSDTQIEQLYKVYLNRTSADGGRIINYVEAVNTYTNAISSGSMTKPELVTGLTQHKAEIVEQMGDYYYGVLLSKFK